MNRNLLSFISKKNIAGFIFVVLLLFRGGYFYYESFVFLLLGSVIMPAHLFTDPKSNQYIYKGQLVLPFLYFLFYLVTPFFGSGLMHYYGLLKVFAPFWLIWAMMYDWQPFALIEQLLKVYIMMLAIALGIYGSELALNQWASGAWAFVEFPVVAIKGRFTGFMQYANVNAILSLLAGFYAIYGWKNKLAMIICGLSLGLSGSRTGWLLALVLLTAALLLWLFEQRSVKKELESKGKWMQIAGANLLFLSALMAGVMMLGYTLGENRLQAGLEASELHTRLLYYKDGLAMIWRQPRGYGHYGYYLAQRQFQTGSTYLVKYIHNFLLQLILDGGMISAGIFLWISVQTLFLLFWNKDHQDMRAKWVGLGFLTLLAHAFWDFDFEFNYILLFVWLTFFYARSLKIKRLQALDQDKNIGPIKKYKLSGPKWLQDHWPIIDFTDWQAEKEQKETKNIFSRIWKMAKKDSKGRELWLQSVCLTLVLISVELGIASWGSYQGNYRIAAEYGFEDAKIGIMLDETADQTLRYQMASSLRNILRNHVETFAFLRDYYYNKGELETAMVYGKETIKLAPLWIEHRQELMRIQYAYALTHPEDMAAVAEDILSVPARLRELEKSKSTNLNVRHRPQWEMTGPMQQWHTHFQKLYNNLQPMNNNPGNAESKIKEKI